PQGIGANSVQDYQNDPTYKALLLSKLRLGDLDVSTLDNSMGVIRVTNGATWRTSATTGADFMLVDNGTIALEGGALRASEVRVMAAGMLVG
ncbi:hypothetical protein, partial [Acinetobacter nosocomialis]